MVMTGPDGLITFSEECANALLVKDPTEFFYPEGCSLSNWPIDEIKRLNDAFLKNLRGSGNVYSLYTQRSGENESWIPVYVGQRKSASLRERITQHLITKNDRTGSMLEKIKIDVSDGRKIAVSYIKVEPDSLRLYVEETIISTRKDDLLWNTHS